MDMTQFTHAELEASCIAQPHYAGGMCRSCAVCEAVMAEDESFHQDPYFTEDELQEMEADHAQAMEDFNAEMEGDMFASAMSDLEKSLDDDLPF
jgi:hypothetical protein